MADFLNEEFHKEDNSERYFTKKELEYVAKMADHSDKNIRENALKFFSAVYYELGPSLWPLIDPSITPKVKGLIDQRVKKLDYKRSNDPS